MGLWTSCIGQAGSTADGSFVGRIQTHLYPNFHPCQPDHALIGTPAEPDTMDRGLLWRAVAASRSLGDLRRGWRDGDAPLTGPRLGFTPAVGQRSLGLLAVGGDGQCRRSRAYRSPGDRSR